jgi:DNA-directed RNA polymerase specialized sigma24 family protein
MGQRRERRRSLAAEVAARLYGRGQTYREISEQLGITVAAAKSHVHAALGASPARARRERILPP